ncbi:MAG: peptidoglycan-associated lipoprotein Pal, partial [Rubrivivax sp.]
ATAALPRRQADTERIVYFDFDRYDIRDEFKFMLERRARVLQGAPQQGLVVEGHADERGGREYNLALGQKRAEAVIRALALLGVQETQLEAVSFGDTRPAAEGHDEKAWSQNRRAELKNR